MATIELTPEQIKSLASQGGQPACALDADGKKQYLLVGFEELQALEEAVEEIRDRTFRKTWQEACKTNFLAWAEKNAY